VSTYKNNARRLIAKDLHAVQSVLLTAQQWDILQFVVKSGATRSHSISAQFSLSPQHTAMIMAVLYVKGYVSRRWQNSPSGGHEYEFTYVICDD
jgi:DNA-binding MarR family transcriptional regulator